MNRAPAMTSAEAKRYLGCVRRQIAGLQEALQCDRDTAKHIVVDAWIRLGPQREDDGSVPVPDEEWMGLWTGWEDLAG